MYANELKKQKSFDPRNGEIRKKKKTKKTRRRRRMKKGHHQSAKP
jgi:hypothetical protein